MYSPPTSNLCVSITENTRIFNETNINRFSEMLNKQCWDEAYEQSDPDLAFTTFIKKLQIKCNEAFPIITRVIPNSKINGWFDAELRSLQKNKLLNSKLNGRFDAELRSLQKDKRASYLRPLRKSDVESKMAYR